MTMTPEEVAALRNEIVTVHALVRACAEAASVIEGTNPKVERTQALLAVAERHVAQLVLHVEITAVPALHAV